MTDSKIKIYSTRYSNIMKLLDFFSVNIFIYVYLIVLDLVPTPSSILLGIIYSLIFIRTNEYFQLYSGQMKGRYLSTFSKLLISASVGVLSYLLIVIAEQLARRPLSLHHLTLAKTIALCSVAVFISMFLIRVVTSRYFFKSKRRVAILGITPAGLAILQELHKEFSAEGIDIRFFEDRTVQRDSRLINIEKSGNSRDLLALAKKGEVDEVYIALPMVAQQRIRQFLNEFSDTTVDVFLVPDLFSYSAHISQLRMFGNIKPSVFSPRRLMGKARYSNVSKTSFLASFLPYSACRRC